MGKEQHWNSLQPIEISVLTSPFGGYPSHLRMISPFSEHCPPLEQMVLVSLDIARLLDRRRLGVTRAVDSGFNPDAYARMSQKGGEKACEPLASGRERGKRLRRGLRRGLRRTSE